MEISRETGTRSIIPFLGLVLQGALEKPDPAIRALPQDIGNTGFRHLLSQAVWDDQQTAWPRCADPNKCLNTFTVVGVGVSVLPFPFHVRGKNSSSLPHTLEKTNAFCCTKCCLK